MVLVCSELHGEGLGMQLGKSKYDQVLLKGAIYYIFNCTFMRYLTYVTYLVTLHIPYVRPQH